MISKKRGGWHNDASRQNGQAGGRPPQSTRLNIGDGIAIKTVSGAHSTAFELGTVARIERGIPRTVVIELRNGDIIYLLSETPKE